MTGYSPRGPNIEAVWRFRASLGPTCSPKDPGERPRFWVVARCRLVFAEDWLEFPVCDTQNTANRSKHVTGKTHRTETQPAPPAPPGDTLVSCNTRSFRSRRDTRQLVNVASRATPGNTGPAKTYTWWGNRAEARGSAACSGTPPP